MSSPRPSPRPRPTEPASTPSSKPAGKPVKPGTPPSAAKIFGVPEQPRQRREPPIDPRSWSGALILMALATAVLWVVEIIDQHLDNSLSLRFGLVPREVRGLWGVLTMPFLHDNYAHLISNTFPFLAIGWVVMLSGLRAWTVVTIGIVVIGDLATWLIAPSNTVIVGASGLIFGWLGYLLARALFSRRLKWIFTAVVVLFFFGTLLAGLFPTLRTDVSWQAHVCGFLAGFLVGFVLHPRRPRDRRPRRGRLPAVG